MTLRPTGKMIGMNTVTKSKVSLAAPSARLQNKAVFERLEVDGILFLLAKNLSFISALAQENT